jgi:quercetin dioxygenase-like cupin family protein
MSGAGLRRLEFDTWEDARGWGMRPMEAAGFPGGAAGNVHLVSLTPGAVRGNHTHDAPEWVVLFGGEMEVHHRCPPDGPLQVEKLDGGKPVLLEIPAGTPHAFINTGSGTAYLMAFADREKVVSTPVQVY